MMYHRLIASIGCTLPGTRTGSLLLALSLVIPSQEGAERLAHLEAEITVVVLQVCPVKLNVCRVSSASMRVGTSVEGAGGWKKYR